MKDQSSGSRKTPSTNDDAGTLTPGFGGLSWPEVKQQECPIGTETIGENAKSTPSILSRKSSDEWNGRGETENEQGPHGTPGEPNTASNKTQKSMPAVASETQPTESHHSFPALREAPSSLENLLEDSAMHLHSLMKGMFTQSEMERAKADCHTFDQHRVSTAATVARQIVNVVRAGLDMAKIRVKVDEMKSKARE